MAAPCPSRPQSRWRRYLRRVRIAVLFAGFALIGVLLYLNLVGLPEFVRQPVLAELRARGLDLKVSNLRWHYFRGIVAEQVQFGRTGDANGPRLTATEAELNLNYAALLERKIEVNGVGLVEGRLAMPVGPTNEPPRTLAIGNIRAQLKFLPQDAWSLEDFQARFAGADFHLTGVVTNASAVRHWPLFQGGKAEPAVAGREADALRRRLTSLADTLQRIRFNGTPELRGMFSGDAAVLESFTLRLTITAPDAATPWGNFQEAVLTLRLRPAAPIERPQAELQLQARAVQTPWAQVWGPVLDLHVVASAADTNGLHATLAAQAQAATTPWAVATNVQFQATWEHALTNAIPRSGKGELRAAVAVTRWIGAREVAVQADLATVPQTPQADPALGPWRWLWPYALGWSVQAAHCDTEKLAAEAIALAGHWAAPRLEVTNVVVRFAEGGVAARAEVDVESRKAGFELRSDFDPHRLQPLLTQKAAQWMDRYGWQSPPHIAGSGEVTLPAWTNGSPDWREEVAPTLRLAAWIAATNATYLKIPADWVRTHVAYTNRVWWLPDLQAGRPEGTLELQHWADDNSHAYWFGVRSTISPEALRPVLGTNAQRGLDYFKLSTPPVVSGGVWGFWRQPGSVGFTGRVELADFAFREQTMRRLVSELRYTNRFLEFLEPRLERVSQVASGPGVAVDFDSGRVYLTNILSTTEPRVITSCIGPKTAAALEPYVFLEPPTVRVNGFAPLAHDDAADLTFDVDGGPFAWWKFHLPRVTGQVRWAGDGLVLSNMSVHAYGGTGQGQGSFDLGAAAGTPFQFKLGFTNVDLKALMADLVVRTNQLEGQLGGLLVVTNANSTNAFTWNGHGHASLHNGLIWAIPVFGVLSKPLDSVVPGLGSTRVSDGTATFSITNGVVFSDTLEMRAKTTRLQYQGSVDFAGQVNARVRAEPMRDTLVIGPVLNLALWPVSKLLEYKITGTLGDPKPEPLHIPKLFYKPFLHPFQTIEEIFTGTAGTNAATPRELKP